jgi:cobalt-zinc-cadmium efflux system outer membrane protein
MKIRLRRWFLFATLTWASGCLYHVREHTDDVLNELVIRPYDLAPPGEAEPASTPSSQPPAETRPGETPLPQPKKAAALDASLRGLPQIDVQTTAFLQAEPPAQPETDQKLREIQQRMNRLKIPEAIPGSETPLLTVPKGTAEQQTAIKRIYPELPPLPIEPAALPGPTGQPYTLAALQQLAAANSPQLRQAVSDVEAARGNLIQARAYPNPTVGLEVDPSNDGSSPGVWGGFVDQVVKTGGKIKLQSAAVEMDLHNAELALRRARSDLATSVRNAYYALLVAKETVRVNKALAHFTEEVYRLQADLLSGGFAAPYEPAAVRAQAYSARLAYKQAISSYIYAWKQLVAVVGLHQAPLTEVAGRIDRIIPYYDYDAVRAHVLQRHTDVLTARNAIDKARYSLMLAQVTPAYPDVEFRVAVLKEFALPPMQVVPTAQVSVPLPLWDKNKGNIVAAEAARVRASEEPHRVEVTLTNNLATAYTGYKNNVDALEYYRKFILPDQVRAYRGVFERRRVDPGVAFGDLVQAQQTLASDVSTYLTILGQLWTSVVGVADLLQTDDLFQLAEPKELPELPDFERQLLWPCPHEGAAIPAHLTGELIEPGRKGER